MSFLQKNLLNITFLLFIFNTSKVFYYKGFYVRGILVDYSLPTLFLSYVLVILLCLLFIKYLTKKDYILLVIVVVFLLLNSYFALNPTVSFIYLAKSYFYVLFFLILVRVNSKFSYKLITAINLLYIFIFVIQLTFRQSVFPFFPFGFFKFNGLLPNMDFINFFGTKIVTPPANFPHPNVFAAFLSFLNIFHLKKTSPLFFVNVVVVTLLGSFSALLFNLSLFMFFHTKSNFKYFAKVIFFAYFIFLLGFFFVFQYKSVSLIERYNQLKISLYLFKSFPTFGVGGLNYIYAVPFYENFLKRVFTLQPAHNILVLYTVEFGLLGLTFFY
jgi:hypothetical protein